MTLRRALPWMVCAAALALGVAAYAVDHSGQVFVFDTHRRLGLFIKPESTPEAISHDLRMLLAEPSDKGR